MSTTTAIDRAENEVEFYRGKLKEIPDIHSDEHIHYTQLLKEARETYNLLLRNTQPQGVLTKRRRRSAEKLVPLPFLNANVKELLTSHSVTDFRDCILDELPFKIPVDFSIILEKFPAIFEAGSWKGTPALIAYICKDTVGDSEQTVISRDDSWMCIIEAAVSGISTYRDKNHSSSRPYLRPDATVCRNMALVLKYEAKYLNDELATAEKELTEKFSPDASSVFPQGCNFVIGITSSIKFTIIHSITYNAQAHTFETSTLRIHDVSGMDGRVDFIVDVFKLLRWIASVERPNIGFHLFPGVRQKTTNGHYITWNASGLLKEFSRDVSRKAVSRIRKVLNSKLPHVEWGVVNDDKRSIIIQRVGIRIQVAIGQGLITKTKVLEGVRAALDELHELGYAHCDIALRNIYFDRSTKTAFLDDLEYLTRITHPPPMTIHNTEGCSTSLELDERQYASLRNELLF